VNRSILYIMHKIQLVFGIYKIDKSLYFSQINIANEDSLVLVS